MYLCVIFIPLYFALHVSGAICTHPQEHKLQVTAIGVCNVWKGEVINSIKWCEVIYIYIYIYILSIKHTHYQDVRNHERQIKKNTALLVHRKHKCTVWA
jgi:hypothetical protein